jgi:hypothetical protein
MVKRKDANDTSVGRVRDTDKKPLLPAHDHQADGTGDLHEGRYKPEMGTVVINDHRRSEREA